MREWLHCMMESMQINERWNFTLGPDYNDVTRQALEATSSLARPLTELRVVRNMPKELWVLAAKRILEGDGQPAFYNEQAIQERLKGLIPHLTNEDAMEFAGNGCTETSFAGCTYAGSTDSNLNVLAIFERYMYDKLPICQTFEEFYGGFVTLLHAKQDEQMAESTIAGMIVPNAALHRSSLCLLMTASTGRPAGSKAAQDIPMRSIPTAVCRTPSILCWRSGIWCTRRSVTHRKDF